MVQLKKSFIITICIGFTILAILLSIAFIQAQPPPNHIPDHGCGTITTLKNPTGTEEINTFLPSDSVYAKGSGMAINQNYTIIIINDTTIIKGMPIPPNITNTVTVTTDTNGAFPPTLIWPTPLTPGNYDIIADCQNTGQQESYDCPDTIDDIEINNTAGFFVIPETPLGTLAALFACLTAIALNKKLNVTKPIKSSTQKYSTFTKQNSTSQSSRNNT